MTGIRHNFVSTATIAIPKNLLTNVSFLVVAGGGGSWSGGGGAGGYIEGTTYLTEGTYTIIIGAGGVAGSSVIGTNGEPSMLSGNLITEIAIGGGTGGGGSWSGPLFPGQNGASGGGGPSNGILSGSQAGVSTVPAQGNNGGSGYYYASGGGGGAGAVGNGAASLYDSGTGGAGRTWLNGVTYAKGGGAGSTAPANSGNGGSGNGASGIVIIRYASTQRSALATTGSPVFTDTGGIKQYVFNSSGTITF